MNSKSKIVRDGALYKADDPELLMEQQLKMEKLYDFNATRPSSIQERERLLQEMFASIGDACYIEPPLYANWAGSHVHMGHHVYVNFGLTLVDDTDIYIGDYTMIGPHVTIVCGTHPLLPTLREEGYQYNLPVHIGRSVWIGANVVILPGVHIHDGAVIGAGSIVTKDIPANTIAVGNPCCILRKLNHNDELYYHKNRKIDI